MNLTKYSDIKNGFQYSSLQRTSLKKCYVNNCSFLIITTLQIFEESSYGKKTSNSAIFFSNVFEIVTEVTYQCHNYCQQNFLARIDQKENQGDLKDAHEVLEKMTSNKSSGLFLKRIWKGC